MGWTTIANITGPAGADGSDADVTAHEAKIDPHPGYVLASGDTMTGALQVTNAGGQVHLGSGASGALVVTQGGVSTLSVTMDGAVTMASTNTAKPAILIVQPDGSSSPTTQWVTKTLDTRAQVDAAGAMWATIDGKLQRLAGIDEVTAASSGWLSVATVAQLPASAATGTRAHVTGGLGFQAHVKTPTGWSIAPEADTGWHSVAINPAAGMTAGTVKLRRLGSTVYVETNGLRFPTGSGSVTVCLGIAKGASGFGPWGPAARSSANNNQTGVYHEWFVTMTGTGDFIWAGSENVSSGMSTTNRPTTTVSGVGSWYCADNWPTAAPVGGYEMPLSGTVSEVMDWVQGDPFRAADALAAETDLNTGKQRVTLVSQLEALIPA